MRKRTACFKVFHAGGPYHIGTSPICSTDLLWKSMDWFLHDKDLRYERIKVSMVVIVRLMCH